MARYLHSYGLGKLHSAAAILAQNRNCGFSENVVHAFAIKSAPQRSSGKMSRRFNDVARFASSVGAGVLCESFLTPLAAVAAEVSTRTFSTLSILQQPSKLANPGTINDERLLALIATQAAQSSPPLPLPLCIRAVTLGLELSSGPLAQHFDRGRLIHTIRSSVDHCDTSLPDQRAALHRLLLTLMRTDVKKWLDTDQRQARRSIMMDSLGRKLRSILSSAGWPPVAVCDVLYVLGQDALLWPRTATVAVRCLHTHMHKLTLADLARLTAGITMAPLHEDVLLLREVMQAVDTHMVQLLHRDGAARRAGHARADADMQQCLERLHDISLICSSFTRMGCSSAPLVDAACVLARDYLSLCTRPITHKGGHSSMQGIAQAYSFALQILQDCTLLSMSSDTLPPSLLHLVHTCQSLLPVLISEQRMPRTALPALCMLREAAKHKWQDTAVAAGFSVTGPYMNIRGQREWKAKVSASREEEKEEEGRGGDRASFSSVIATQGRAPEPARMALYAQLRTLVGKKGGNRAQIQAVTCLPFVLPSGLVADAVVTGRDGTRVALVLTRHSDYMHAGVQVDSRGAPKAGAWHASWQASEPVVGVELAFHIRLAEGGGIIVLPVLASDVQVQGYVQALIDKVEQFVSGQEETPQAPQASEGAIPSMLGLQDMNAHTHAVTPVAVSVPPAGEDSPALKVETSKAVVQAVEQTAPAAQRQAASPHQSPTQVRYLDITPAQLREMHPGQPSATTQPFVTAPSLVPATAKPEITPMQPKVVAGNRLQHNPGPSQARAVRNTALREALDRILHRYSAQSPNRDGKRKTSKQARSLRSAGDAVPAPAPSTASTATQQASDARAGSEDAQARSARSRIRYLDISPSQLKSAVLQPPVSRTGHGHPSGSAQGKLPARHPPQPRPQQGGDDTRKTVRTALQRIMGKYGHAASASISTRKKPARPAATFRSLLAFWPAVGVAEGPRPASQSRTSSSAVVGDSSR